MPLANAVMIYLDLPLANGIGFDLQLPSDSRLILPGIHMGCWSKWN